MAQIKYNLGTVGGGINVTELWSGSVGSLTGEGTGKITLNDEFTKYKFLIFDFYCTVTGDISTRRCYSRVLSVQHIINAFNEAVANTAMVFTWEHTNDDFFSIVKDSTTTKVLNTKCRYTQCLRIFGIN